MKFILALLFFNNSLMAEYRVYQLLITNTQTNKTRTVYSTLDWIQYPEYNHLARDERVEMVDHWMCWKRSHGFKPLCQRPVTADTLKSENPQPEG